jgi:hypothetical protein
MPDNIANDVRKYSSSLQLDDNHFFLTYPQKMGGEIRISDLRFMRHVFQSIKLPFGNNNHLKYNVFIKMFDSLRVFLPGLQVDDN